MRRLAAPFVVAPPTGARIRTRLRPTVADERVLCMVGEHLGRLAGYDLAVRCRLGVGDDQRTDRKRTLTAAASSRWAGAITRTSNDQWQRAQRNLLDVRVGLRRACRTSDRGWPCRSAVAMAACVAMRRKRSGSKSRAACSTLRPSSQRWSSGLRLGGCRCAAGVGGWSSSATPLAATTCRSPRPDGGNAGRRRGGSSSPMGRPTRPGATRRSESTLTSTGWSCGCPPPWRACPIRPAGRRPTGCRVRSASAIGTRSG